MRTSLYSILCIVIRLSAVIFAVDVLYALLVRWEMYPERPEPRYFFGVAALELALAAGLWIYPGVIARLAAGRASREIFESPLSAREWQQIAVSVVGIAFAVTGIVELAGEGGRLVIAAGGVDSASYRDILLYEFGRFIPSIAKTAAGVALTLGSRGLAAWLLDLRERGEPPVAESQTETVANSPPRDMTDDRR